MIDRVTRRGVRGLRSYYLGNCVIFSIGAAGFASFPFLGAPPLIAIEAMLMSALCVWGAVYEAIAAFRAD